MAVDVRICDERAIDVINTADGGLHLRLAWLGQAGFVLRYRDFSALIDPYLSNSLAEKYKDTKFPHIRMMQTSLQPEDVKNLNLVLCSHRHTDHLDPGTLLTLAAKNLNCKIVVPRAEISSILSIGISEDRFISANAGDVLNICPNISIEIIPSAHEELKVNDNGEHSFLGFIIRCGNIAIYHSGDCVPYDGLLENLKSRNIDAALLPVNGRDEYRTGSGILGNFTFDEAVSLCKSVNIPLMIAHHYAMFDFNTVDEDELRAGAERVADDLEVILPQIGKVYELRKAY